MPSVSSLNANPQIAIRLTSIFGICPSVAFCFAQKLSTIAFGFIFGWGKTCPTDTRQQN